MKRLNLFVSFAMLLLSWTLQDAAAQTPPKSPFVVVLGIAQDGGVPQTGTKQHPGWEDPSAARRVACLALVDPVSSQRWMFDATPDFPEQLHGLDVVAPVIEKPGLDGIFLTHAHMGHYTGLMYLGHESLGARDVPVFAMPRMRHYLRTNGPWSQLVRLDNIRLQNLSADTTVILNERLAVDVFSVPHRQEYSEVVGYRIRGPRHAVLFIPDIDSWEEWDDLGVHIEEMVASVDVAYLDGSFYANGEIPGRDMSGFPHPFISRTMARFEKTAVSERAKIRFIHLNHTNPALWPETEASNTVVKKGFRVAVEGEKVEL